MRPHTDERAALLRECRAAWVWWQRFADGPGGVVLMFVWALAEAVVWPVIPDALLVPLAAGARRHCTRPLLAAIAGMALGGTLLFTVARSAPEAAARYLAWLPLVGEGQVATARERLAEHGAAAFLIQPWSGIPFKVWGLLAGMAGMPAWPVVPLFIVARAARMTVFAALARLLARRFDASLRDFSLYLALIYVALFVTGWWLVSG
jgi:1-acyl-sn-glycerol-3-phosphate acyltransferase